MQELIRKIAELERQIEAMRTIELPSGGRDWTVSWTNLTVGNGTYAQRWFRFDGEFVDLSVVFTLGSTSSVSLNAGFTPPITASANDLIIGFVYMTDVSVGAAYMGYLNNNNGSFFRPIIALQSTTYPQAGVLNSNVPFTWTTGDILQITARYRVA